MKTLDHIVCSIMGLLLVCQEHAYRVCLPGLPRLNSTLRFWRMLVGKPLTRRSAAAQLAFSRFSCCCARVLTRGATQLMRNCGKLNEGVRFALYTNCLLTISCICAMMHGGSVELRRTHLTLWRLRLRMSLRVGRAGYVLAGR